MNEFKTKEELIKAYATTRSIEVYSEYSEKNIVEKALNESLFEGVAMSKISYQPQYYKGGHVIPGFGYSTERIGEYVSKEEAGDASLVS